MKIIIIPKNSEELNYLNAKLWAYKTLSISYRNNKFSVPIALKLPYSRIIQILMINENIVLLLNYLSFLSNKIKPKMLGLR